MTQRHGQHGPAGLVTHNGEFCSWTCYTNWTVRVESAFGADVRMARQETVREVERDRG